MDVRGESQEYLVRCCTSRWVLFVCCRCETGRLRAGSPALAPQKIKIKSIQIDELC
jgi:hypothetical protein